MNIKVLQELGIQSRGKILDTPGSIPLFSIMRDETYFLPYFLDHYRKLGVSRFFIYADRCSEEFLAMLEKEDDVVILFSETLKFGDTFGMVRPGYVRRLGCHLRELFSNRVFPDRWHVVVDADEFLLLPLRFANLMQYTGHLEKQGRQYSFSPMVDFYPVSLAAGMSNTSCSPFEGSPYFDVGPYHAFDPTSGSVIRLRDGIRTRIAASLFMNHSEEMKEQGVVIGRFTRPLNYKFPVLKTSQSCLRVGTHDISSVDGIGDSGVLAHFKFYPGLDEKLNTAVAERQYSDGSAEYKMLQFAFKKLRNANLVDQRSRKYSGNIDLVRGGFLQTY